MYLYCLNKNKGILDPSSGLAAGITLSKKYALHGIAELDLQALYRSETKVARFEMDSLSPTLRNNMFLTEGEREQRFIKSLT